MRGWLIGWMLVFAAPVAAAQELRLAYTDQDISPYLVGEGTEIPSRPGLTIELVRQLVAGTSYRLVLTRLPARRLHEEIRTGHQDGLIGTRYTEDRAALMIYPFVNGKPDEQRHLGRIAYYLYAIKDSPLQWDGRTLDHLDGGMIGIPSGVTALRNLRDMKVEIVEAPSSHQLFSMLARRRVAAVATVGLAGDAYLGWFENAEVVKLVPPLWAENFYIPFTHVFYEKNRAFAEAFWSGLDRERDRVYRELGPAYR